MLLAIDTSTQLAGLALYDGAVRAELSWVAGRKHSAQLLPQVERLLALVERDVSDLTAIAAARGPGSFTGVRVGLAAAQGIALARDIPAFGVSTLDVLAFGQEGSALPVRPLLDAGRGRFATALYRPSDGGLRPATEVAGIELADLDVLVTEPCLLCGDLDEAARERLRAMLGDRARIASPAASLRRPSVLAQLGWERYRAGEDGDPAALEPLYLTR